ncbi:hypothetical protein D3C75_975610 [compost metagenome]
MFRVGIAVEDNERFGTVCLGVGNLLCERQFSAGYQDDGAADIAFRIIFLRTQVCVYDLNRISADNAGEIIVGQFESHYVEILISGISNRSCRTYDISLEFP